MSQLHEATLRTKADVFIIESLDPDDEGNGRFEGGVISQILRLHRKQPLYRYVRTIEEFKAAVKEFGKSRYRYLHISAHGDPEGLCTTNQETIDFDELGDMLRPHLKGRRLFLSACSMVHNDMAAYVIPKTECFSIMGPEDDIEFHRAALFWASLYHLMFLKDAEKFNRARLTETLTKASALFEVNIKLFCRSDNKKGFDEVDVHSYTKPKKKPGPRRG
ncbi:hypothetical protein [Paracoccus versutus]|uniref:CHAT domain-containing protein n=1 Tax=Paracoccus versutus TaxID=34007 RepID=A0A3D9XUR2_PARVE|nr:hypothetical protein [Paracoccus versutus]REF73451.1 hypothetical protein BDD41_2011 [Paracoccus versutus]